MVTSARSENGITWKLVSSNKISDGDSYEYECPIQNSKRKYHLSMVASPKGEHRSYSVI